MTNNTKANLDALRLSDIYSLLLFILYKTKDIPEYAVASELCYLLDSSSLIRMINFFAGKTIKIPTEKEFTTLIDALLLYQYINIDNMTLTNAVLKLPDLTRSQRDKVVDLYLKIIPIVSEYNINREKMSRNA